MFFLLPLVGAAVGAAVGAFATHAAGENDRQAAKYHRQVANDLSSKYSNLERMYNEYADKSRQQINDLTRQHALDEAEKDFLRLAIRLQQSLYVLMWDIDDKPTHKALVEFEKAVLATNTVLFELNEEFIQVPDRYFTRNLERINETVAELSGRNRSGGIKTNEENSARLSSMKEPIPKSSKQISDADCAKTPVSVRQLIEALGKRVEQLEQELEKLQDEKQLLHEQGRRNSQNSSGHKLKGGILGKRVEQLEQELEKLQGEKQLLHEQGKRNSQNSSGHKLKGGIYPIKQCLQCGQQNRIRAHNLRCKPICGKCRAELI